MGVCWVQAAPYVAALAGCYAEAQAPPVQLFHTILEVNSGQQHLHKFVCPLVLQTT